MRSQEIATGDSQSRPEGTLRNAREKTIPAHESSSLIGGDYIGMLFAASSQALRTAMIDRDYQSRVATHDMA